MAKPEYPVEKCGQFNHGDGDRDPNTLIGLHDGPGLDRFLSGLRTAWKEGEIRPTAKLKPKQKRERRRPDPFAGVTDQLRAWFDEEPWRTSRELLERLQAQYPENYPDLLLRTLQRRVKTWRKEKAHAWCLVRRRRSRPSRQRPTERPQPWGASW